MRKAELSLAEIALVAGTRGLLGAGLALMLADRIAPENRKLIGWMLLMAGSLSTIPLALDVLLKSRPS